MFFIRSILAAAVCLQLYSVKTYGEKWHNAVASDIDANTISAEFAVPRPRLETAHFVVYDVQQSQSRQLATLLEQGYDKFSCFFKAAGFDLNSPQGKYTWFCFNDIGKFNSYTDSTEKKNLSWLSSYYSTKTNRVAILFSSQGYFQSDRVAYDLNAGSNIMAAVDNGQTDNSCRQIFHELAHQMAFNTGLQKRGVMYPLWVSEGLATFCETVFCQQPDVGRCHRLTGTETAKKLIPMDDFICLTRLPSDSSMHAQFYAQAQEFFDFLLKSHAAGLKNYLKNIYLLEPGRRSENCLYNEFSEAFGPMTQIRDEWSNHIADVRIAAAPVSK